jgi:hypothetical protein
MHTILAFIATDPWRGVMIKEDLDIIYLTPDNAKVHHSMLISLVKVELFVQKWNLISLNWTSILWSKKIFMITQFSLQGCCYSFLLLQLFHR